MDFPSDNKVWNINNEYLFGKSILVCPVTDSMYASRTNGETAVDLNTVKKQKTNFDRVVNYTGRSVILSKG